MTHALNSHAFRISSTAEPDAPGLVYSGDCGIADDLLPLIRRGDTLLCEASWGVASTARHMPCTSPRWKRHAWPARAAPRDSS